ncbi:MAG: LPXTG cell wall anchor domain-containing protein [Bacteroidetes bacterium]|nr:LPXTG cell wall anchor domain-containing protein [Bacteroidota bacterium]
MHSLLLDLSNEPTIVEKSKNHIWLVVISLLALAGVIVLFIWKKNKKPKP